jgi:sugar phosphate isomerase/epimerase
MEWPPLADVTLSYHTLSGSIHGQRPLYSLRQRAMAAKRAGMTSVGWCHMDYRSDRQLRDDAAWFEDNGMRAAEGEWLELSEPDVMTSTITFIMGQAFGADRINAGWCSDSEPVTTELAAQVRDLARRAADFGQTLAFEPVAFGALSDIRDVQTIVAEAGMPNLGTLLDAWQLARSYWSAGVTDVDVSMAKGIQLSGVNYADPAPDYPDGLFHEAQHDRRLPDEGSFPVREWLKNLIDAGVDTTVACEVISDEMRAMPLTDAAETVAAALGNLLATAPYFVRLPCWTA